jgi:selenocysteine lyase/cysteine desulfurase
VTHLTLGPDLRLRNPLAELRDHARHPGLFGFPAQSNFSGVRHPLDLIEAARALGFDVLLDLAAFVPSQAFSLRQHPADFAVLSFYKIFGYPTGVGALVARRSSLARLVRPWFAGGTVEWASSALPRHQLRPFPDGFEDGTANFLAIAGLEAGFRLIEEVGLDHLAAHVEELTRLLLGRLLQLRHPGGAALCRIYGPTGTAARGGIVTFNVLDRCGGVIPFELVEARANAAGVALRGGCFCNPGAAEAAFAMASSASARCLDGLGASFSYRGLRSCLGPGGVVGAVRASLGLANNAEDVHRAVDVVASFGATKKPRRLPQIRRCGRPLRQARGGR